ncbi:hypothetical protein [Bradyrhizobium sp. CCBAU 45389]|uniref:hypothetical protein n=1 Tax=Bradyrhizobium sp. CCBAU 45389 TaxID=858429 RepID=UPI002305B0FC|nr:hypothetical protein [Bradyrhizobium sp. CCBAU 45389]
MVTSLKLADVVAGALGLPPRTVVQHLRNLQKAELISFKGYGRGAAHMSPHDAARLLIAAAGSDFVKDSLTTLRGFGALLPIRTALGEGQHITLEDHLAGLLTKLASEASAEPGSGAAQLGHLDLSLVSVANIAAPSHAAILRWGPDASSICFAAQQWKRPITSVGDYAQLVKGAGLIREKHLTREALQAVAHSL